MDFVKWKLVIWDLDEMLRQQSIQRQRVCEYGQPIQIHRRIRQ